jgi:hypothetical protein
MNSPLLALFTRSLREDAYGKATYWIRAGLGVFILIVLGMFALEQSWSSAPGRSFFAAVIALQMVTVSFVGLSYFASAVTEEKEEQTLGLLRMTDLNPLSILLGKSTSRLCGALFLLVAQFPFTAFAVTLGGVSMGQVLATYFTVGAYTFMLCNVALLGSVLAKRTTGAATFTVLVMFLLLSAGAILEWLHGILKKAGIASALGDWANRAWELTPIARLFDVLETGFTGELVGSQVIVNVAIGIGSFLLAWAAFDRCCDRNDGEAAGGTVSRLKGGWGRRPPRLQTRALVWKDFHFLFGGRVGAVVRFFGYGGALAWAVASHLRIFSSGPGVGLAAGPFATFAFSIDLAAMAARLFRSELNGLTLSALGSLPFTIRQISYQKSLAFLLAALPGGIVTSALSLLSVFQLSGQSGSNGALPWFLAQMVSGWIGFILLVHVVVWISLKMARGALPIGYVLNYALNTILMMLIYSIVGVFRFGGGGMSFFSSLAVYAPLAIAAVDVVLIIILHRASLNRLEALIAEN